VFILAKVQRISYSLTYDTVLRGTMLMQKKIWNIFWATTVTTLLSAMAWPQPNQPGSVLVLDGHAGQAEVIQKDGRAYVDLQALMKITNGSLRFSGSRIVLSLPTPNVSHPAPESPGDSAPRPVPENGLSRDFMKAGIEEFATMREWASTLAYAIQNNYHVTDEWAANYREKAAHNLRLAASVASTEADRSALQLLTNEFEAVRAWSDKLVEARKSMDTAKYTMSADALRNEPQSQKILTCGRFLASMLGSSSFQDDPSCH